MIILSKAKSNKSNTSIWYPSMCCKLTIGGMLVSGDKQPLKTMMSLEYEALGRFGTEEPNLKLDDINACSAPGFKPEEDPQKIKILWRC